MKLSVKYLKVITTPIFYANGPPHLGHLYTLVLSDAINRWNNIRGEHSKLATGLDEHGTKVQQKCRSLKMDNFQDYCDGIADEFGDLSKKFSISYDIFQRTTSIQHRLLVQSILNELHKKDLLEKKKYRGFYSMVDECFVDKQTISQMTSDELKEKKVEEIDETNYFFPIHKYLGEVENWIKREVKFKPEKFRSIILNDIKRLNERKESLSITRNIDRVSWAIAVPFDHSQTIYVWFDALLSYLTSALQLTSLKKEKIDFENFDGFRGKLMENWPPKLQIMGKEIVKFHLIYFPSILLALGLNRLPTNYLIHGHWLKDEKKMSKSIGNVTDVKEEGELLGRDQFRYYLLRTHPIHNDANYSRRNAIELINADLVNTFFNLFHRCANKNLMGETRKISFDKCTINEEDLLDEIEELCDMENNEINGLLNDNNFSQAIQNLKKYLINANQLIEKKKFWEVKETNEQLKIIRNPLQLVYLINVYYYPIIPQLSEELMRTHSFFSQFNHHQFRHDDVRQFFNYLKTRRYDNFTIELPKNHFVKRISKENDI